MSDPNQLITQAIAVLREAHEVADAIRSDADRYLRERRSEADLLLGKARRVLFAAETKAEAIVAAARDAAVAPVPAREVAASDVVLDLDALAAHDTHDEVAVTASGQGPSSLDRLLDAAIARAVTQALPREPAS